MNRSVLITGDAAAIALIIITGFVTHDRVESGFLPRAAALSIPLMIVWFVLASKIRLFDPDIVLNPRQLWRPAVAMIASAPLAIVIRAAVLSAEVTPIFMIVLGLVSALGITAWRVLFLRYSRRSEVADREPHDLPR